MLISSTISLIFLVVVIVVVLNNKKHKNHHHEVEAYHPKSVETICEGNENSKLCHEILSSAQITNTLDPKAFIVAAVEATTKSVIHALKVTDSTSGA